MTTELRDYRIRAGNLDEFLAAWSAGVPRLRSAHGFRIDGAWVVRSEDRFLWLLSLDGDLDEFERRNNGYYADPQRKAMDPDPAAWVERADHVFVEPLEAVG